MAVFEPFYFYKTRKWIGAFFFWIIKGCKGKITSENIPEKNKRNLWAGYIISLLFVLFLLF